MALIQGKSRKSMSKNITTEMEHGKPQKQAIAIAYNIKRKNKNKKASGGTVESGSRDMNMAKGGMAYKDSAKTEQRPMPSEIAQDHELVSKNKGKKALADDSWTDQPTMKQTQMNSGRAVMPIKRPRMVPSDSFSTRLYDKEGHLEESMRPGPTDAQPEHDMDEEGAKRQGPESQNLHMKKMAAGGDVHDQDEIHEAEANEDHEMEMNPAHDEHSADDSEDQQIEEEMLEHHASIAAAIMAKRARKAAQHSDSDIDHEMMLAKGGEILSHDSIHADDADQADLSRNVDEDANEEDQLSFNALRKENYNESEGLKELDNPHDSSEHGDAEESNSEDEHDMISRIRSKMRIKHALR